MQLSPSAEMGRDAYAALHTDGFASHTKTQASFLGPKDRSVLPMCCSDYRLITNRTSLHIWPLGDQILATFAGLHRSNSTLSTLQRRTEAFFFTLSVLVSFTKEDHFLIPLLHHW